MSALPVLANDISEEEMDSILANAKAASDFLKAIAA